MPIAQYPAITGKNHKDETYKKFLQQDFSNNFGVDKKSMAGTFVNSAANNIYNLSKEQVLNNVIPYLEKELGGYTVFLTKSVVEGGGTSCNYLNHYSPSGMAGCQSNYMDGLKVDVAMVKATLNGHVAGANGVETNQPLSVNLSSFESNYQVWPEDNPGSAEKMFKSMPKGSIGIHYMSMTHAGNGWVFQTSYANQNWNGYPYSIGNAYDQFIQLVKDMGGNALDGKKGSSSNGKDNNKDDNIIDNIFDGILDNLPDNPLDAAKKVYQAIIEYIEDLMQWDMHSIGTDKYFSNKYFSLMKTYNNTYKLKINVSFYDELKDVFGKLGNDAEAGEKDNNDSNDKDDNDSNKNSKYNGCYITSHGLNFRYGKTVAETQANGYPFAGTAHHGNDYDFRYEALKSPISGTVNGNNGHGFTVNDGGIGYDGDGSGWGHRIVIKLDDGSGRSMLFGHLSKINVKPGDKVKVGQVIGVTGNSGEMTTGAHLHVELVDPKHPNRADDRTIDPTPFLEKHCKK